MILREWEIWHTYSTCLDTQITDIDEAALAIVDSGIATFAMTCEGGTYWREDHGVDSGYTSLSSDAHGCVAKICPINKSDSDNKMPRLIIKAWNEAVQFRSYEMRLFDKDFQWPPPYVRASLGPCNLISSKDCKLVRCYPTVKLYESGIILIEIRIRSSDIPITVEEFIDHHVNLPLASFDRVEVPPALSQIAARAYAFYVRHNWPINLRAGILRLEREHDRAVLDQAITYNDAGFTFCVSPLISDADSGQEDTLSSLALTIAHSIAYVLSKPRRGLSFLLLGQRAKLIQLGNYWSGRPYIHLMQFDDQMQTTTQNEKHYHTEFGCILAKIWAPDSPFISRHLPASSREFDDYGAYITAAGSLFVMAKKGFANHKKSASGDYTSIIYEHQVTAEMLEYGYMLHRSLFNYSLSGLRAEEAIRANRDTVRLEQNMADAGCFGEIRDLLQQGWEAMGVSGLRKRIRDSLEIRKAETALTESRDLARRNMLLTIIFGMVAVPPIAEEVVSPVFDYFKLWHPTDESGNKLFMIGIAILITILFLLSTLKIGGKFRDDTGQRYSKDE